MITNTFAMGPEGWCSYDYHASMVADGRDIFILSTWRSGQGPKHANCVMVDHRQWSADTPEVPVSILPLLTYRKWLSLEPVDLRQAEVTVYLRGDNLATDGAACYFWVNTSMNRWHLTSQPLHISEGCWAELPNRLNLVNDESKWHNSWAGNPPQPASLDSALAATGSYGFAFVGFRSEVTGRLSMAEFTVTTPGRGG
jgi:hypothetical protein